MKNEVSINSTEITFGEDERSYQELVDNISIRFVKGRAKAYYEVNKSLVYTNWDNGRYIVEFEQSIALIMTS